MFKKILKTVIGDPVERALAAYREVAEQINALEPELKTLKREDFPKKTQALKDRLQKGEALDDLLTEAFALVREAAVRTIRMRHYDVQLIGGMVLHEGRIAEMKTGEGKTLVATLPIYLNALTGRGVHLVTPNDYLSKVGLQTMGPVYHFLGLTAAVIQNTGGQPDDGSFIYDPDYLSNDARYQNLRPCTRRAAYHADITYGTNNEFGFDYLRDNMVWEKDRLAQRDLYFAIVDEVDNILIDEARTPLIISGPADQPSDNYKRFSEIVRRLKRSTPDSVDAEAPDGDYVMEEKDRVVYLTESGVERVERALGIPHLYTPENAEMIPYLDNCLRALALYHRDKEYIVQEGQVIIVDEFTGRLMYGRRFSEGLHQAIEAKEGVEIRRENITMATITFQNYFRMYDKLAGMTGTAATEAEEFEKIYELDVVAIPTNVPVVRIDHEDLIFMNEQAKWNAVVHEIRERSQQDQPILVGTVAIETSEKLSKMLKKAGVEHEVLNAKQHEREATIITQAGRPGSVTIATNMAGRGVDILLGGNPEGMAREKLRQQGIDVTEASEELWNNTLAEAREQAAYDRKRVIKAGGLFVLGTERHEARRIDNQLRGRSGRQGDPGESRFYLSLEDELMRRFAGDRVKNFMSWANMPEDEPIQHSMISKSIAQAQIRVEGHNFDIRKRVLEYDDVVNKQREVIYGRRRDWLNRTGDELQQSFLAVVKESIEEALEDFFDNQDDEIDTEALYRRLLAIFPLPPHITPQTFDGLDEDEIIETVLKASDEAFQRKAAELEAVQPGLMERALRLVMLRAIDFHWQRHLTDLDVLREGIGLMSVAQRDPLVEYKRESFTMFDELQHGIREQSTREIFAIQANIAQRQPVRRPIQTLRPTVNGGATPTTQTNQPQQTQQTVRSVRKIGRNDPCHCGSGKKYKHCHLKLDESKTKEAP